MTDYYLIKVIRNSTNFSNRVILFEKLVLISVTHATHKKSTPVKVISEP